MASSPTRRQGHRQSGGVTLTEVVVAASLLALAVVPLLKALTIAQGTGTLIERKTRCLILAQTQLDEVRAKSIHHYDSSFQETSKALGDSYLCSITDDEDPSLRLVTVAVGYDADGNNTLNNAEVAVRLSTCLARRQ